MPGAVQAPARVLLVDDSIVARAVLGRAINGAGDLTVAAQAGSARQALDAIAREAFDLVVLDLEMPGTGGLEVLPALLAARRAPVLIVSSAAGDGAAATITALRLGAADTLLKPVAGLGGAFADALVERLRRLAARGAPPPAPARSDDVAAPDRVGAQGIGCVAIGASTGGVHALAAFFATYPPRLAAPILVTQHLPAPFMPHFARQLGEMAGRPVRVAADGMALDPGAILLAPGDASLGLGLARTRGRRFVRLDRQRSASGCLPSVDPMFAAVAAQFGRDAVGVVLSGMGRDGLAGAAALHAAGAPVLVQDAATSVVWGMPGVVAQAGYARAVAPPGELGRRLAALQQAGTVAR